jgi:hypothetical protein
VQPLPANAQVTAAFFAVALLFPLLCRVQVAAPADAPALRLPALRTRDAPRFLVTAEGRPFFWPGDTAWELFHRLDRAEAELYRRDRAAKGFNVI